MHITKLEKQKKYKGRVNIYADDCFLLGVMEDTVYKFGLNAGDELTEERLSEIKKYDEYNAGKKIVLDFLSYRNRSRAELKQKLRAKKISDDVSENILKHLDKLGFIDDRVFAKEYAEGKINTRPVGKRMLEMKLKQKGITKDVIDETLNGLLTSENEKQLAYSCYKKYLIRLKGRTETEKRRKIYEHLTRKGFDYETISEIINQNIKNIETDIYIQKQ